MEANKFLGLVKFFRDESFLDKLISGCLYCKTPENYRLDKLEGVSDKFESCQYSYRTARNDSPVTASLAGQELEGLLDITIHKGVDHDSWLHCWMSLRIPKDQKSLDELKADVKRLKSEFGSSYAFIPAGKLAEFVALLQRISDKELWCKEVIYSHDKGQWSSECKGVDYSYQREYRFGFGRCSPSETTPYIINHASGFHDFVLKNPELKLHSQDGKEIFFDLGAA